MKPILLAVAMFQINGVRVGVVHLDDGSRDLARTLVGHCSRITCVTP